MVSRTDLNPKGGKMLRGVPRVPESLCWASHADPKSLNLKRWHCSPSLAWVPLEDLGARTEYGWGGRGFSNGNNATLRFWFAWSVCNVPRFLFALYSPFISQKEGGQGCLRLCRDPGHVLTPARGCVAGWHKEGVLSKYKTHHEFWPNHFPSGLGPKHTGISGDRFQWALALSQSKTFKHSGPCPSRGQLLRSAFEVLSMDGELYLGQQKLYRLRKSNSVLSTVPETSLE